MNRAVLVVACLAGVTFGVSSPATARTHLGTSHAPAPKGDADAVTPTLVVARIASAFDVQIVPPAVVDRLVRWQLGVRDLAHGVSERLAEIAHHADVSIPDLRVLTTEPVAASRSKGPSSGFGWRDDPIHHDRKWHAGADIRADHGTPVMAAGDGIVVFCGRQGGYGNVIYVDHGGGVTTRYAHLRKIETKKDAAIVAGQRIGQVGSTGRATGPHLHFEIRLDGRPVEPNTVMAVAALERESPAEGTLAAYALAPDLQATVESDLDPPKTRGKKQHKSDHPDKSRPDRPGFTKRPRPLS